MRLVSARIRNFRCIEDSEEFDFSPVTCLVGKNESGKTAVLQALYRLNPYDDSVRFDVDRDYPRRHLADFSSKFPDGEAPVLETSWELSSDDSRALVAVLGPSVSSLRNIRVLRAYNAKTSTWSLEVDEAKVVAHLIGSSDLHAEERTALAGPTTIQALTQRLSGEGTGERHAKVLQVLTSRFSRGRAVLAAIDVLVPRMPKFVYFSQYDRIPGRVPLEVVLQRFEQNPKQLDEGERLFIDFCAFSGSSIKELSTIDTFERLKAKFEGASNKITDQIFEYWTQNSHLRVEFSSEAALSGDRAPFNTGRVFNIRIRNDLHGATLPFDERSAGFVWFFSFLVMFSQVSKTHSKDLIVLLDEPGLNLHGKAQEDLLRYIEEELAPKHQVVYTTHSPFLVPANDLLSVRTVEDVVVERKGKKPEVLGTKVRKNPLDVRGDTLFPLLGALGFEITQSLFVGKNTLVVEGPSDLLYLYAYSRTLIEAKRTGLDPAWVICPVGGIDKVPAFMALFGANKLNLAVLLDFATGGKRKVEEARRLAGELLKTGSVFTAAEIAGTPEGDIEDAIGVEGYVALVNLWSAATPPVPLPTVPPPRVVPYVEGEMRTRGDFNHYAPAEYLIENRRSVLPSLPQADAALDRFEAFFKSLNRLVRR